MGWKNVQEHYRIGHIVMVDDGNICIGSAYIPKIITICGDGEFRRSEDFGSRNEDLSRYQREMLADMDKLRELVQSPDTFTNSIKVYTYDGGEIIEKLCETPGWPNVTHDGQLMYDNAFSTDRGKVVEWAIKNAEAGVRLAKDRISDKRKELAEFESLLKEYNADLKKLLSTKAILKAE